MVKKLVMVIDFALIQWFSEFFNLYYQNAEIASEGGGLIKFFNLYYGRLISRGG